MKFSDLIDPRSIVADLQSADRNGVVRELVQQLAQAGVLPAGSVESTVKAVLGRERRGTTGFGKGVAMPHGRISGISRPVAAVGRSAGGIDFASLDGEPVFAVFLILSPEEPAEVHLQAIDLVFRILQDERFRKFLRQADQPEKIYDLLKEQDEKTLVA